MAVDRSTPILLVDDYGTMLRIVHKLLRQIGFHDIDEALDGPSALLKMGSKKYGLVISDWNMAPMSGHELLERVRSDPELSATPFVIITAESKSDAQATAQAAGASGYITKPFNAETLQRKIDAVFAG
jgi:two-component system chemotaxis response regulator CheY